MTDEKSYTKKIFLRLQIDGAITLDKDYLWDGCDTPEIDPEIDLTPVPITKLAQLVADLNLDYPEKNDIERLNKLLTELNVSADIIASAIKTIEAKFPA